MIGDRLETDVLFGKNGGISTLLVLTGMSGLIPPFEPSSLSKYPVYQNTKSHDIKTGSSIIEDLDGLPEDQAPDYVANCVGEFLKAQQTSMP
jgi:hypothetical protein